MSKALILGALHASNTRLNVIIEKTARELRGTAYLELEEVEPAKQEICCSRSFGKSLKTIEPIQEALTAYATRAAEKRCQQGSLSRQIRLSLRTGMFNPTEVKYANGLLCQLPYPTDDTRLIIAAPETASAGYTGMDSATPRLRYCCSTCVVGMSTRLTWLHQNIL